MAQVLHKTIGARQGRPVNLISDPNGQTIPAAAAAATLDLLPVLYMKNEYNLFRSSDLDAKKVLFREDSA